MQKLKEFFAWEMKRKLIQFDDVFCGSLQVFSLQSDCNKSKVIRRLLAFKNKSIYIHILQVIWI